MTSFHLLRTALVVTLGVACAAPGGGGGGSPAPAVARGPARLYVPNQSDATVTVIDPASGAVVTTVDLKAAGFTANAKPHAVIAEPDGSAWYVTIMGDGWVAKFDRDNRFVGKARMETPGMLALDPKRDRLYASRSMTAVSPPSSIGIIRASDMTLLDELDVILPRPHGIAADPVTGRVYVSGLGDNRIATVTEDGRVDLTDVPGPLHAFVTFALSKDGKRLAASTQLTHSIIGFDVSTGTPTQLGAADVKPFGYQIAWSPDGQSVWSGNQRSGAVTEVSATTWTVAGVISDSAFAEPHGVAVSADSRTVYVSSHGIQTGPSAPTPADTMHHGMHAGESAPRGGGTLAIIDARTRTVRKVIPVGRFATAVGLTGP
ncbi:MAG TPA: YncE family protein [Gemmatimonadales bacterium]|nr:YncE family protein [Gemmatimonadales bacterium]